jgi:pimeloyl-ACP methyl ester carboxylesterase
MLILKDVQLHYEVHGSEGPPLLMIAGLASDVSSWQSVLPELSKRFRVILMDNRGVGRSKPEDPEISIGLMADDCAALIDHLGYGPVHVLGHSMGGMVAMDLAIRHPQKARSLVLAATGDRVSGRNAMLFSDLADRYDRGGDLSDFYRTILYWIFSPPFFEDRGMVEEAVDYLLAYPYKQSPRSFRGQVEAITSFRGLDLGRIQCPTLVLAGERDLLFPLEEARDLARRLRGAQIRVLAGAAHSVHEERPAEFVAAVEGFIKGVDR